MHIIQQQNSIKTEHSRIEFLMKTNDQHQMKRYSSPLINRGIQILLKTENHSELSPHTYKTSNYKNRQK